ncbi:hypothetical protein D3C86_1700280 [compost metagenome]
MGEVGLVGLRVVVAAADAAAVGGADDDRAGVLPARAVAELRHLVDDLVDGREDVVHELDLGDRAQAVEGHADGGADDAGLGEGGVDDPVLAELLLQADGGAEDAAELAHVLAHDDHPIILAHLDLQGVVDGLDDVHRGHYRAPSAFVCCRLSISSASCSWRNRGLSA